jgi:8-oxo-dGTP pyrophosphatase MutT (NUDIX family)
MFLGLGSLSQAAALPFRVSGDTTEVLFVTSRRRQRWVLPKGWPKKSEALWQAAAREAREEAGVEGEIARKALGSYRYEKRMRQGYDVPCDVFVYPFHVIRENETWREGSERERLWCPLEVAPATCHDADLVHLLTGLAENGGQALVRSVADAPPIGS